MSPFILVVFDRYQREKVFSQSPEPTCISAQQNHSPLDTESPTCLFSEFFSTGQVVGPLKESRPRALTNLRSTFLGEFDTVPSVELDLLHFTKIKGERNIYHCSYWGNQCFFNNCRLLSGQITFRLFVAF